MEQIRKKIDLARSELLTYARFLGWLHATPYKGTRSRAEELRAFGNTPDYPKTRSPVMVYLFAELGSLTPGGVPHPITWGEIDAWNSVRNIGIGPNAALILHEMSDAYISSYHRSSREHAECPIEKSKSNEDLIISRLSALAALS